MPAATLTLGGALSTLGASYWGDHCIYWSCWRAAGASTGAWWVGCGSALGEAAEILLPVYISFGMPVPQQELVAHGRCPIINCGGRAYQCVLLAALDMWDSACFHNVVSCSSGCRLVVFACCIVWTTAIKIIGIICIENLTTWASQLTCTAVCSGQLGRAAIVNPHCSGEQLRARDSSLPW
jgi:hypothetical protein